MTKCIRQNDFTQNDKKIGQQTIFLKKVDRMIRQNNYIQNDIDNMNIDKMTFDKKSLSQIKKVKVDT